MTYTIFDRLAGLSDIAVDLEGIGLTGVHPCVILIGSRGSGKSTLLWALTGEFPGPGFCNFHYSAYLEKPGLVRGLAMAKGMAPTDLSSTHVVDVPYDLSLMREYMKQPSSVIVVVIASNEPKPEELLMLVAEFDPKYERTVGVYSKIDRIPVEKSASMLLVNDHHLPFKVIGFSKNTEYMEEQQFYESLPYGFVGIESIMGSIGTIASRLLCQSFRGPQVAKSIEGKSPIDPEQAAPKSINPPPEDGDSEFDIYD